MAGDDEETNIIKCIAVSKALQSYHKNDLSYSELEKASYLKLEKIPKTLEEGRLRSQRIMDMEAELIDKADTHTANLDIPYLLEIYNADTCQTILHDHQNKTQEELNPYFKSLVSKKRKKVTCKEFKEQFEKYEDFISSRYKSDLQNGLFATLKDSLSNLNKSQINCIESLIKEDFPYSLGGLIIECEDNTYLPDYLSETKGVKECKSKN